jgi:hypothetical protein
MESEEGMAAKLDLSEPSQPWGYHDDDSGSIDNASEMNVEDAEEQVMLLYVFVVLKKSCGLTGSQGSSDQRDNKTN